MAEHFLKVRFRGKIAEKVAANLRDGRPVRFPGHEPRSRYEHLWFSEDGSTAYAVEAGIGESAIRKRFARYRGYIEVVELTPVVRRR